MIEQQTPHQELPAVEVDGELLARFEAKNRGVAERGLTQRELLHEAVGEHIKAAISDVSTQASQPVPQVASDNDGDDVSGRVAQLANVAISGSLADAIKRAEAAGPHVLAELHEQLVDVYWRKLVESGRILAD